MTVIVDQSAPPAAPATAHTARIDLAGTDLGLPTPPHVREAAKRALDEGATHYTTRPGLDSLRAAVAEKLDRVNGIRVDPTREILITCGTQEALFVALHFLLRHGEEILIPEPANPAYAAIARQARARVRAIPGDPGLGFAPRLGEIAGRVSRRSRVLILSSPATPAGTVPDEATLNRLAELATRHDLVVIADESYEPFVYDGAVHRSIAALPGMAERTITINGFSRPYAMHGWRVGYVAGPARLIGPIMQLKQALSICSPAVSQYAALAAITGPQSVVDGARTLVADRRTAAFAALERTGIPYARPAAGYHILVHGGGAGRTGADLARWVTRKSNVLLEPGSTYGTVTSAWLRLSLTQPVPLIEEAIQRLRPLLGTRAAREGIDG